MRLSVRDGNQRRGENRRFVARKKRRTSFRFDGRNRAKSGTERIYDGTQEKRRGIKENEMNTSAIEKTELNKILSLVAEYAVLDGTKTTLSSFAPFNTVKDTELSLKKTKEAEKLL